MTRTDPLPDLPAWMRPALASSYEVELPPGRFRGPRGTVRIDRPGQRVSGAGTTLVYRLADLPEANWIGVRVGGRNVPNPSSVMPRGLGRLTGQVTGGVTDRLTLAEPWPEPFVPGERVQLHLGVRPDDPAEPFESLFATVAGVEAGQLVFTRPLPRTIPTWASGPAFAAALPTLLPGFPTGGLTPKIGPWGTPTGPPADINSRGFGRDHGLLRFADGVPVSGVRVDCPLRVEVEGVDGTTLLAGPNIGWPVLVDFCEDVRLAGVHAHNPPDCGLMLWHAERVTVGPLRATGWGYRRHTGVLSPASALTVWGGGDLRVESVLAAGRNIGLFQTEIAPRNLRVGPADWGAEDVTDDPSGAVVVSNLYGDLPGAEIGPVLCRRTAYYEGGYLLPGRVTLRGVSLPADQRYEANWSRYLLTGPVTGPGGVVLAEPLDTLDGGSARSGG